MMITAALLVSGGLFYFYTFNSGDGEPQLDDAPQPAVTSAPDESPSAAPDPPVDQAPIEPATPPEVDPAPAPPTVVQTPFRQPQPLAEALRDALVEGDAEQLAALLGHDAEATTAAGATEVLTDWLDQLQAQGWNFDPLELIGRHGSAMQFQLPLRKPDPDTGQEVVESIEFNLGRQPDLTWTLEGLTIAPALAAEMLAEGLAAIAHEKPEGGVVDPAVAGQPTPPEIRIADGSPDALKVARAFLQSLLKQDYETARQLVAADRVPAERLAGLCIVFEEGRYEAVPGQLIATAVDGGNAWVVAQVRSEQAAVSTELGIELEQIENADGGSEWLVSGLNLSQLLSRYTSPTDSIPYVPIVEHPAGGESLVLFFEFDDADLHERAKRQLDIIARLLKADETKTIRISGHTDARGAEDYNQRLSRSRAERVRVQLLELGVPVAQVITEAFGPERPLSPNLTPDGEDNPLGRARNRRAEIYLDF